MVNAAYARFLEKKPPATIVNELIEPGFRYPVFTQILRRLILKPTVEILACGGDAGVPQGDMNRWVGALRSTPGA